MYTLCGSSWQRELSCATLTILSLYSRGHGVQLLMTTIDLWFHHSMALAECVLLEPVTNYYFTSNEAS